MSSAPAPAAPVFVARRVRWPLVGLVVGLMVLVAALAVLLVAGLGWQSTSLLPSVFLMSGLVVVPVLSAAVDTLLVDAQGVTRMGPATVRSHVPWSRVRQLEVTQVGGRPALVCNLALQPQPGPAGRIDPFPLSDVDAASVIGRAAQLARQGDPGWQGRPGAAMPGWSIRTLSAPARRWWAAALVGVLALLCGVLLVRGGRTLQGTEARLMTQCMGWAVVVLGLGTAACVPWLLTVGVDVAPEGIRASTGRRVRLRSGISMTWPQVLDLSVASLPLASPRLDGRAVRRPVLCVRWHNGRVERIAALRVPPEQCQQLADLLHAYRPDLI